MKRPIAHAALNKPGRAERTRKSFCQGENTFALLIFRCAMRCQGERKVTLLYLLIIICVGDGNWWHVEA